MPDSRAEPDAIDVALHVARAIEAARGAYFVGGSLASSLQGEPRATNDIDMVIELPIGRVKDFVRALGAEFEVDVDMLRDALVSHHAITSCLHPRSHFQNPEAAMKAELLLEETRTMLG